MTPPIFQLATASISVTALLGSNPTRLWPFGEVPREATGTTTKPYAVWQIVDGSPENNLSSRPTCDVFIVQVDAYAKDITTARAIAEALRDSLELSAHIVRWNGDMHDPDTSLYRHGFTVEFFTDR